MDDTLHLTVPFTPFPHQERFLRYEPDDPGEPYKAAILGWYGSGKTSAGALAMLKIILQNPRTEAYGAGAPRAVIMAPTMGILKNATMPVMRQVTPPELIQKEWKGTADMRWLMANGLELAFVSANAEFEGVTLAGMWIDEIQHPLIADRSDKFINYFARLRDPNANRRAMIITGKPEAGWVREQFDLDGLEPEDRVNRYTQLCGTNDNPTLTPGHVAGILQSMPAGSADAVRKGGWLMAVGSMFPHFDQSVHIVPNDREDPNAPVHVGFDVGTHSAAVLGQDCPATIKGVTGEPTRGNGLLVVDEIVGAGLSVEDLCTQVKLLPAGHRIIPGKSQIYVDPTIRVDELNIIRRHFKGVHVAVKPRTDPFYSKGPGVRLMQAALLDGRGNTTLWFCRRLQGTKSGIIDAVLEARYSSERSGLPVKDDRTDHSLDALRYLTQGRLGTLGQGFAPRVVDRR